MKYIFKKIQIASFAAILAIAGFSSCNKGLEEIGGPPFVTPMPPGNGKALGDTLATKANDSLYYKIIVKAGLLATLNNKANQYTVFVPTNSAVRTFVTAITGGAVPSAAPDAAFAAFINSASFPAASAAGIVSYNIIPQRVLAANIPATFPNFQYPTLINPAPTVSALLRLTTFPSTRNGTWLNNTPITSLDNLAANGVYHEIANVVVPPSTYLWDRINADSTLTFLKAAIQRADSGTVSPGTLVGALLNIGANLTVYAPTDSAFKATLSGAIYQALVAQGFPAGATTFATATALATATDANGPTVFRNPVLYGALSAQTVKGIVVYHILGVRAFNNNLPTTRTNFPTLLNGAIPTHPGIGLMAVLTGNFVSAVTVKGAANATAANVLINPTPAPAGTSDQFYLNGVLHKIDQVLLPQ